MAKLEKQFVLIRDHKGNWSVYLETPLVNAFNQEDYDQWTSWVNDPSQGTTAWCHVQVVVDPTDPMGLKIEQLAWRFDSEFGLDTLPMSNALWSHLLKV